MRKNYCQTDFLEYGRYYLNKGHFINCSKLWMNLCLIKETNSPFPSKNIVISFCRKKHFSAVFLTKLGIFIANEKYKVPDYQKGKMKVFSRGLCGAQEAAVQCGDPRMICHFSLVWLASWHGENVCPLRSSRWLRTNLLQVINVLRKFVWNGILVDNLSLCLPSKKPALVVTPWGPEWILQGAQHQCFQMGQVPAQDPLRNGVKYQFISHRPQTSFQISMIFRHYCMLVVFESVN